MAERNPDALERVIARVKQLVQERKTAKNAALLDAPARGPTIIEESPRAPDEATAEKQSTTIVEEPPSVKDWFAFERINAAGSGQPSTNGPVA